MNLELVITHTGIHPHTGAIETPKLWRFALSEHEQAHALYVKWKAFDKSGMCTTQIKVVEVNCDLTTECDE